MPALPEGETPPRLPADGDETPPEPAYEPPRLVRLGSLFDLLGKTGTRFDAPNPHFRRP